MDKQKKRKRGRPKDVSSNTTSSSNSTSNSNIGNPMEQQSFPVAASIPTSATFSRSSGKKKKKKKQKRKLPTISASTNNNGSNVSTPIAKVDHDATLALLKTMDWTMAKNTSRRNVIRADDRFTPRNKMNKPYCMSFIFGRNMKDPTGGMSWWSTNYPHVYAELRALIAKYDPDFEYTHITLNCNLRCKRHTDGGNAGPSYIAAFGPFQGGELIVEQPGGGTPETVLDCKSKFVLFNGKTQPHETAPFTGERFTLVYYTSDIVPATVDRRLACREGDVSAADVSSSFKEQFEAVKSKLGRRKKRR